MSHCREASDFAEWLEFGGVVTGAPGLYVLGMPVLRTRASTYIHGAAADSGALADHLYSLLSSQAATGRVGGKLPVHVEDDYSVALPV
jgi:hypothetical protein